MGRSEFVTLPICNSTLNGLLVKKVVGWVSAVTMMAAEQRGKACGRYTGWYTGRRNTAQ